MAPKKKKGGEDPEVEEERARQLSKYKSTYKATCEQLGVPPLDNATIGRIEFPVKEPMSGSMMSRLPVLGQPVGPAGCSAIVEGLKELKEPKRILGLKWLCLFKCDILDEGATILSELLRNKYCIEKCELEENDIGWQGANSIGLALKANIHLTSLAMDKNPLGDEGVAALADGLRWNGHLTHLSLNYCGIGCYGAGALAQDVIANDYCRLTDLGLQGNEIEPEGVASIADSLKMNLTLTAINLADTGMGDSAISRDAMREALVRHPTLTSLNLNLNAIGTEGGQMLLEVLSLNTNIVQCGVFERLVMYRDIKDKVDANGSKKKGKKKKKKKK